ARRARTRPDRVAATERGLGSAPDPASGEVQVGEHERRDEYEEEGAAELRRGLLRDRREQPRDRHGAERTQGERAVVDEQPVGAIPDRAEGPRDLALPLALRPAASPSACARRAS